MKYVLTGSIGHISKSLAKKLIQAGNEVFIITSKRENEKNIEQLGGRAITGNLEDGSFVKSAFAGADAVYLMIPPKWTITDWLAYQKQVADNYTEAIKSNAVKKVVVLSSVGAHMKTGAGPVDGLAYLEDSINKLQSVDAGYLRPSYLYYNLFSQIPLIKSAGIMGGTQPGDYKIALTHTDDIAEVAAKVLLDLSFKGKKVQYIVSDVISWKEVVSVLGKAIDKPDLSWVEFTDEQSEQGMLSAGLNPVIVKGYVQMGKALRSGEMQSDLLNNNSVNSGKIKLEDFAKEFAGAFLVNA